MFHDGGEAHRETIHHAAERVISGRFFRPEIPAAGGGLSHYPEYGMIAGAGGYSGNTVHRSRNRRICRVFPVEERADRAGKAWVAAGEGVRGMADFLGTPNKKEGGPARGADPPG